MPMPSCSCSLCLFLLNFRLPCPLYFHGSEDLHTLPSGLLSSYFPTMPPLCRCVRHNVSDTEYDEFTKAYDLYRRSLTGNRIPLYATTIQEIAMNWSRGFSAKYHMHVDTAVHLLLVSGKYYFHGSLARVNGGFEMDMCALPSRLLSNNSGVCCPSVPFLFLFCLLCRFLRHLCHLLPRLCRSLSHGVTVVIFGTAPCPALCGYRRPCHVALRVVCR